MPPTIVQAINTHFLQHALSAVQLSGRLAVLETHTLRY